jgi:hypothetical protein
MRRVVLAAALAAGIPIAAHADELADLKAQLEQANKSIQALQKRMQVLENQRAKPAAKAAPAEAAPVVKAPPVEPAPVVVKAAPVEPAPPVVAPNERLAMPIPGVAGGRVELYGAVQLDAIYDGKSVDPDWEATLRPSKIPVVCPPAGFDPGCGKNGVTEFSARQTTFGLKGFLPTEYGEIKTQFEFDLYGMGPDAGNTMFRLKQAWGSVGPYLAGYTYTLFMDPDVFPNIVDFWGPSGMNWLFDPQIRYTPYDYNGLKLAFALEGPGASVDVGKTADVIPELADIRERKRFPDITGQIRQDGDWGHVQFAGVARWISFEDPTGINAEPANTLFGWGVSGSAVLNTFGQDALRAQVDYGRGIAAYSNDCCFDLGPNANLRAQTLPLLNYMVYYDHWWNAKWSSAVGFSQNQQQNSAGQFDTDQFIGSYGSVNLLYRPIQNLLVGIEGLWGERINKDGAHGTDQRVQFTTKWKY